jgi:hypothetical protein
MALDIPFATGQDGGEGDVGVGRAVGRALDGVGNAHRQLGIGDIGIEDLGGDHRIGGNGIDDRASRGSNIASVGWHLRGWYSAATEHGRSIVCM